MQSKEHSLKLNAEHVAYKRQTDLDDQGIAKNAREEKIRARDLKQKMEQDAENQRMAALYREVVLKEKKQEGFVPLGSLLAPAKPNGNGKPVQITPATPAPCRKPRGSRFLRRLIASKSSKPRGPFGRKSGGPFLRPASNARRHSNLRVTEHDHLRGTLGRQAELRDSNVRKTDRGGRRQTGPEPLVADRMAHGSCHNTRAPTCRPYSLTSRNESL